jgi:hypothetical protein
MVHLGEKKLRARSEIKAPSGPVQAKTLQSPRVATLGRITKHLFHPRFFEF